MPPPPILYHHFFCRPGKDKPHWSVPYYYRIRLYWLLLRQLHRPANWVFRRSIAIPIALLSTLKPYVTASVPRPANGGVVSSLPDEVSAHYFRLLRWTHCLASGSPSFIVLFLDALSSFIINSFFLNHKRSVHNTCIDCHYIFSKKSKKNQYNPS